MPDQTDSAAPAAPAAPPFDPANPFTGPVPASLTTGTVRAASGQTLIVLCIRTPAGTTSVFLGPEDAERWEANIRATRKGISPLIVPHLAPIPRANGARG